MLFALNNGPDDLQYRDTRKIKCWLKDFKPVPQDGLNPYVTDVRIDLEAPIPFPRGILTYGTTVTLSTTTTTIAINYGGTAPTYPKFVITALGLTVDGTGTPVQIRNLQSGEILQYVGIIPPGSSVTINTEELTVTQDGTDDINSFDGQFPTFLGGSNTHGS